MEYSPKEIDSNREARQTKARIQRLVLENERLAQRIAHFESSKLWQVGLFINRVRRFLGLEPRDSKLKPQGVDTASLPKGQVGLAGGHSLEPRTVALIEELGTNLETLQREDKGLLFLTPFKGQGGGMHSIYQEAKGLKAMGFRAAIAADVMHQQHFRSLYTDQTVFLYYQNKEQLLQWADEFRVMIATYFKSVELLEWLAARKGTIECGYYVQDYEPWFFQGGSEWERIAYRTYGRIVGMTHFAKTEFLAETVEERHGIQTHLIPPSLDHEIFRAPKNLARKGPVKVVAMIRPETPWRRPELTLEMLVVLKRRLSGRVEIHTFGCDDAQLNQLGIATGFEFTHHGKLQSQAVASLFQSADIFVDLSIYQGFGRTGLEAMACACVPILPEKSGPATYAIEGVNALLINTGDINAALEAVEKLVNATGLLTSMAKAGLQTAAQFSIQKTALAEFLLFHPSSPKKHQS